MNTVKKLFELIAYVWNAFKQSQGTKATEPYAEVVCDSISPSGDRLTTMVIVMHRFVLAEFNTHRVFSRNSESSRAVPTRERICRVLFDLAWPVEWGKNQAGMQAYTLLSSACVKVCRIIWRLASLAAVMAVVALYAVGLHKQLANRLLEPFLWHTVVVTSTEWENYFAQRATEFSPLAQPELRATSDLMLKALRANTPKFVQASLHGPRLATHDNWHLPFVGYVEPTDYTNYLTPIQLSVARCARSAYGLQLHTTASGINASTPPKERETILKEFDRYEKLVQAKPMHASPLEHVARPMLSGEEQIGNFKGWRQWRHEIMALKGREEEEKDKEKDSVRSLPRAEYKIELSTNSTVATIHFNRRLLNHVPILSFQDALKFNHPIAVLLNETAGVINVVIRRYDVFIEVAQMFGAAATAQVAAEKILELLREGELKND